MCLTIVSALYRFFFGMSRKKLPEICDAVVTSIFFIFLWINFSHKFQNIINIHAGFHFRKWSTKRMQNIIYPSSILSNIIHHTFEVQFFLKFPYPFCQRLNCIVHFLLQIHLKQGTYSKTLLPHV